MSDKRTEDEEEFVKEHVRIFGHRPIYDLRTGNRCLHPMHDAIKATMEAPGVHIELPMRLADLRTLVREEGSDDEAEIRPKRRRRLAL